MSGDTPRLHVDAGLRQLLATSPKMAPLLDGLSLLEVAKHPRMPIETWTLDECMEALDWVRGTVDEEKVPSAIVRHLAPLRGKEKV